MKMETGEVAVFWDYENCQMPSNMSGYDLARSIRDAAHAFGSIKSFKAYAQFSEHNSPRSSCQRSELQSSGVSLIDCPHSGRKNVVDQMIIADMLAFAMDNPSPSTTTIILISGDRDFAYPLALLRLRMYPVVVIALPGAHASLKAQATSFLEWTTITVDDTNAEIPSSSDLRAATSAFNAFRPKAHLSTSPDQDLKSPSWRSIYSPSRPNPFQLKPEGRKQSPNHVTSGAGSNSTGPLPTQPGGGTTAKWTGNEKSSAWTPAVSAPVFGSISTQDMGVEPPLENTEVQSTSASPETDPSVSHLQSTSTLTPQGSMLLKRPVLNSTNPFASPPASVSSSRHVLEPSPNLPDKKGRPVWKTATYPKFVPLEFQRLVQLLEAYRLNGIQRPLRSSVALELTGQDPNVYKSVRVTKFSQYSAMAAEQDLVVLGGKSGLAWISLHPELHGKL